MKDVKTEIKNHLLKGKRLTGLQALQKFGTIRLSSYINRLRNDGYNIQTDMITRGNKTFASYKHII